jgi:hypothetical protein
VGLVVDDIVQESPMLKGFPVFDVDQVEVLRGPQGTLFGRNSPAGVIKFDSAKPVIGKTEGYGTFGIGNYGAINAEGAFNLPISDTMAARVSLQSQNRDDRVHNPRPNAKTTDFEGYNDNAARLQLLVKPSRDFSALFNVHARDMTGSAMLFRANIMKQGTNELVDGFNYGPTRPTAATSSGSRPRAPICACAGTWKASPCIRSPATRRPTSTAAATSTAAGAPPSCAPAITARASSRSRSRPPTCCLTTSN